MQIKNAVCYSLSLNSQDVLAQLRLVGPLQHAGINIINGIVNDQAMWEYAAKGDIIVIQRDFPGNFNDYQKITEIAKDSGKPIVFDMDDLLFCLPKNHPARQSHYYAPSLLPMFQVLEDADLVTVSTPKLKTIFDQYHENVVVLPNYFDDSLWSFRQPRAKDLKNDVLLIGYISGNTHAADLEYIAPALLDLVKHYHDKIRLHFWGAEPPDVLRSLTQSSWTTHYYRSYRDFVEYFGSQSADIFIAPLQDNLFNQCKSPIKFLDYAALGAPGVFSRLEPYSEIVVHGRNGLLAGSVDEWFDCILQLIENRELRLQMANEAQATVRAGWLLSRNAYRWREAYSQLTQPFLRKVQEGKVNILQSINIQMAEAFAKNQQQVQALDAQIAERNQHVQALGAQIAERNQHVQELGAQIAERDQQLHEITRSRAWRLVLTLRRIRAILFPPNSWATRLVNKMISLVRPKAPKY